MIEEHATEGGTVNNGVNILTCGESTAPPGGLCASACSLPAGVRTEPNVDSGETALGKVVTVNGLSILVTASNFIAPKCSVAEGMTTTGATELSFDFGWSALHQGIVVNGPLILVTASTLSELKCSVEEGVTGGVAVDDSADISSRCASTTTLGERLRASTFSMVSEVVTGLRVDFGVNALQEPSQ